MSVLPHLLQKHVEFNLLLMSGNSDTRPLNVDMAMTPRLAEWQVKSTEGPASRGNLVS